MDHATVCDCPFKDTCKTYADELIDRARKGSRGLGCAGQSDLHRSKHCQSFRCKYLSLVLSDMLAPGSKSTAPNG